MALCSDENLDTKLKLNTKKKKLRKTNFKEPKNITTKIGPTAYTYRNWIAIEL